MSCCSASTSEGVRRLIGQSRAIQLMTRDRLGLRLPLPFRLAAPMPGAVGGGGGSRLGARAPFPGVVEVDDIGHAKSYHRTKEFFHAR